MLSPDPVEVFVGAFDAERARARKAAAGLARAATDKFSGLQRRLDGVLRAIEDGALSPSLQERLTGLERSKAALAAEVAAADRPAPIVRLHPDAAALYRNQVADLEASLPAPAIRLETSEALRWLIDRVTLTPDAGRLDAVTQATLPMAGQVFWTGSGGLALALAQVLPHLADETVTGPELRSSGGILFVVGSAAKASRAASALLAVDDALLCRAESWRCSASSSRAC